VIDLRDAYSACPDEQLRAYNRVDPYFAAMWDDSSTGAWSSKRSAKRRYEMGITKHHTQYVEMSTQEAQDTFLARWRGERIAEIASVMMWRTLTVEQMASIVGTNRPAKWDRDRRLMWAGELIEIGTYITPERAALPEMIRPFRHGNFDAFADKLTYRERLAVTANVPWRWGGQFDRHNVITTELALRIAEYCPVSMVFGEMLAATHMVSGTDAPAYRGGDAVIVRPDGFKIVIESTANAGNDIRRKMEKWVDAMIASPKRDFAVCFVEMSHPDRGRSGTEVLSHLKKFIQELAHSSMGASMAEVEQRLMYASWHDWFPAPGKLTQEFLDLSAYRPTGPKGSPWEKVSMVDLYDLEFSPDSTAPSDTLVRAPEVISNASLLAGVPYWLRTDQAPDIAEWILTDCGFDVPPVRS